MSSIDPVVQVRRSCEKVSSNSIDVTIDDIFVETLAEKIIAENGLERLKNEISWDEFGWHYCEDAPIDGDLTCQYIFVLDSLNFCFWPNASVEYEDLAKALKMVCNLTS